MVAPDAVLRRQRRRFREAVDQAPPGSSSGAARPHGDLLTLGIDVAECTVSRLMPMRRTRPSQTWRTFLTNHFRELVTIELFTVRTAHLRVLFVLIVLAHQLPQLPHA
jgi:hypothetical protein